MAGKGKPNFLSAMAALKGKVIKGLAPTGAGPTGNQGTTKQKKVFGKSFVKGQKKGGNVTVKGMQN